jgi:hypothetical protein
VPGVSVWLVWIIQSRGERLSICAPVSAPFSDSDAEARSEVRPTSTAETVTGPLAGKRPFADGAIVRTIGGADTAEGETCGLGATPADGCATGTKGTGDGEVARPVSVGGIPSGVGVPRPGTAPRNGRSLAGPQAAKPSTTAASTTTRRIAP